jgi:HEAT repeat protein
MPLVRNPSAKSRSGVPVDVATGLKSASVEERWSAARSAGDPASVVPLTEALSLEKDARVREAIFTAFARIATRESALAVTPYLRADDASIRTGALDALRAMPRAAEASLPQLLTDGDPDVRLLACELARPMNNAESVRLLCELLEREAEANVCAAAVEVLAEIADRNAAPALSRCATRFPGDPFLTFAIEIAIGRLRSGSADPRD